MNKGVGMFGHDKHKDDDEETVTPSKIPVNEGLLGVNDDDDQPADDTSSSDDNDDKKGDDPTDLTVASGADVPQEDSSNTNEPPAPSIDSTASNDLLDIKRQALQALSPLVDHLDQTPEEKFKTTMMMIQASDDQSLVAVAYEAAKQISDDKERAQALLDIINEINYFTQPKKD